MKTKTETTVQPVPTLKAIDMCDTGGCVASAKVLVKGLQGELLFCGHHYHKNEKELAAWAYDIVDERYTLEHKPGASA